MKERYESDENPMNLKKELAFRVTSELKSKDEAKTAEEYFESIFQNKSVDTKLKEVGVNKEEYDILELITEVNLAPSKSQARRLIEQGAVQVNEDKISDWQISINLTQPITLKVGKRILQITYQP
jgi:tyrosyl-tRNA synthetase